VTYVYAEDETTDFTTNMADESSDNSPTGNSIILDLPEGIDYSSAATNPNPEVYRLPAGMEDESMNKQSMTWLMTHPQEVMRSLPAYPKAEPAAASAETAVAAAQTNYPTHYSPVNEAVIPSPNPSFADWGIPVDKIPNVPQISITESKPDDMGFKDVPQANFTREYLDRNSQAEGRFGEGTARVRVKADGSMDASYGSSGLISQWASNDGKGKSDYTDGMLGVSLTQDENAGTKTASFGRGENKIVVEKNIGEGGPTVIKRGKETIDNIDDSSGVSLSDYATK